MKSVRYLLLAAALSTAGLSSLFAVAPYRDPYAAELKDFRTIDRAISTTLKDVPPSAVAPQPGYLGANIEEQNGKLVVLSVEPRSPAERAGLKVGDVLVGADGKLLNKLEALAEMIRAQGPGSKIPLRVQRSTEHADMMVTLGSVSRPLSAGSPGRRVIMGVQIEPVAEGIRLTSVTSGLPADKAGLKVGDILTALDGKNLAGIDALTGLLDNKENKTVKVSVKRDGKTFDVGVTLALDKTAGPGKGGKFDWDDRRSSNLFRKPAYNLAVVCIEYPDVKHNSKIAAKDWANALFSTDTYTKTSATGQKVYGSMNDYYIEQSLGKLKVTGKVFDWVEVKRKRAEYSKDANRYALLTEALDLVQARDGKQALDGYDGVFFLYAGERFQTNRGGLYWPHKALMTHNNKRWSYFICPEGGKTMDTISVITHEFGHMLGLPDLYARPETPGAEGLGVWCTMATGHGRAGRPLHFSAWCKERMGWLKPTVIDPRVKQKLILEPIFGTSNQCYKVIVREDGSEYLLLENRIRRGFEKDLPAEGLLIWRVADGKVVLEESHGVLGPAGPGSHLASVPYPSASNNAFTPFTQPSSKSVKGGGLPVHITNIKRLPDGRITFHIGYEYL